MSVSGNAGVRRAWQGFAVVVLALVVAFVASASPSNKWRLKMDGKAKVDGEVELSFTPEGGAATSLVVPVPRGTSENAAARLISAAVTAQFGKEVYHAETDDGEDVLIKKHGSTPDFDLVVVRNTADGLHARLHRE